MRINEILTEAELAEIDRRGFLRGMGAAAAAAAVPGAAQAAIQSMTVNGRKIQPCSAEWVREIQDSIRQIKDSIQRRQQMIKDPNMSFSLRSSWQDSIRQLAREIDQREQELKKCQSGQRAQAQQTAQPAGSAPPGQQPRQTAPQDRTSRLINRPGDF